jgi:hypothetical protein
MATIPDFPVMVREVFVPGGFPKYTYQNREKHRVESNLKDAIHRLPKFIAVAGPTKTGKTVLVRKVIPDERCVWIDAGHIKTVQDVWNFILADFDLPNSVVESDTNQNETSTTHETEAGIKPGGIGGSLKNAETSRSSRGKTSAATYGTVGPRAAIDALLRTKRILVIDDFHYLSQDIQSEVIRALKPAVFKGLQVVLLLIPHRMHQAAQAEMDVDGRTHTISIPEWQPDELFSIAETGFEKLHLECAAQTIDALVQECFSSPHIMQDFCSSLCAVNGVYEEYQGPKPRPKILIPQPPEDFFKALATSISPQSFKALRQGPPRTNRKPRELTEGGTVDTYEAILLALHELGGATPVDWPKMRKVLQNLLKEVPQQHEVTRALENMDEIAKEREGEPVIDYSSGELHLVDPFFRFYLKWNTAIRDEASS